MSAPMVLHPKAHLLICACTVAGVMVAGAGCRDITSVPMPCDDVQACPTGQVCVGGHCEPGGGKDRGPDRPVTDLAEKDGPGRDAQGRPRGHQRRRRKA